MTQRFDTILKSGTVVNHDGEGVREGPLRRQPGTVGERASLDGAGNCPGELAEQRSVALWPLPEHFQQARNGTSCS